MCVTCVYLYVCYFLLFVAKTDRPISTGWSRGKKITTTYFFEDCRKFLTDYNNLFKVPTATFIELL